MAQIYQANHFTGEQLDNFMHMVLKRDIAGRGLEIDQQGVLQCTVPGYTKRIFTYTHTGNTEVHASAYDPATGIFTAPAHGLSNRQMIFVTVHPPYNISAPHSFLPGGMILGATGNASSCQVYYAQVIDQNSFQISTTSTGEPIIFTENPNMDLSKFHFEIVGKNELSIEGLDLRECLLVFKGKVRNAIRWVHATNAVRPGTDGNQTGGVAYDAAYGADNFASCYFGRPGYNFTYATLEFRMIGERQLYQVNNIDYVVYDTAASPAFKHNRQYYHMMLSSDVIEGIKMYSDLLSGFFNGTTVEVYAK